MYFPAPSALTFALQSWHNARPTKDNEIQLSSNIEKIKKQILYRNEYKQFLIQVSNNLNLYLTKTDNSTICI